ncbi:MULTISPECIES: O-antigen ligase family protein [Mycolicibacter]|uniref:O-antigen ligase family protein n=1 Tax=[Mycobacterium] vasticus TaxID=2875777 RepID=A0ABU5YRP9_9MYCO|nr:MULTISPECIES: O-antigen ligase family protein [unclassified Mycolicibacter]MEB3061528.1 O-antigen ligase family protein [Mycolicibacter sp. MYC101]MEB3067793.1 O-antigen ligase family protein [Mycolicibacter sp. MYC017]
MTVYARGRQRLALTAALWAPFLFGCFAFGVLSVRDRTSGLILVGVTFCVVVYWARPQVMMWIALFLSCGALPEGLPPGKIIGPVMIYGHHVPLVLAVCYLISTVRPEFRTYLLPGAFALTVVFSAAVGLAAGNPTFAAVREASILLEMVAGFMLAILIVHGGYIKEAVRVMAVTLWVSAGLNVMASMHLIRPLTGRVESAAVETGAAEATRVITNSLQPSIAVLAALVAGQIVGRVRLSTLIALAPPALISPMLAISRNTLIAVGLAVIVASLLSAQGFSTIHRISRVFTGSALSVLIIVPGALFLLQHTPAGSWLADQFTGYQRRVLGGVSTNALAADASTKARLDENSFLIGKFDQAPLFGHGLGYEYQPSYGHGDSGFDAFANTLGTTYAHNFYLWWLVKAGAVGMAVFAALAVIPLYRAIRRASAPAKVSVAVAFGLLVMSVVDPMPEDIAGALTMGMTLGAAMAFAALPRSQPEPAPTTTRPTSWSLDAQTT